MATDERPEAAGAEPSRRREVGHTPGDAGAHDELPDGLDEAERRVLARSSLFRGLKTADLEALWGLAHRGRLRDGEILFREREPADHVYVVKDGTLEGWKRDSFSGIEHPVETLRPGDPVGELALLDREPRSFTVKAKGPVTVLGFSIPDLIGLSEENHPPDVAMRLNLAGVVSHRLRSSHRESARTQTDLMEQSRLRMALGVLLNTVVLLFCAFLFTMVLTARLVESVADTILLNIPLTILFAGGLYYAIRKSGLRLDLYGLTLAHWKSDVAKAVLLSVPWFVAILVAKMWMMENLAIMADEPLFEFGQLVSANPGMIVFAIAAYCVFAPAQEFITRSGVQSALELFLVGKHRELVAMIIATLMFIFTHIHLDPLMPLLVAPLGFFWGWIYMKQKSLVGVSVSHALIGLWALYVVGFGDLIPS